MPKTPDRPDDGIHLDSRELADALDPDVGEGSPDTAPHVDPADELGFLTRRPVLSAFLVLMLPAFGSAVEAVSTGDNVRAILSALGTAALAAIAKLVERKVTPVALPRIDADTPLTP